MFETEGVRKIVHRTVTRFPDSLTKLLTVRRHDISPYREAVYEHVNWMRRCWCWCLDAVTVSIEAVIFMFAGKIRSHRVISVLDIVARCRRLTGGVRVMGVWRFYDRTDRGSRGRSERRVLCGSMLQLFLESGKRRGHVAVI